MDPFVGAAMVGGELSGGILPLVQGVGSGIAQTFHALKQGGIAAAPVAKDIGKELYQEARETIRNEPSTLPIIKESISDIYNEGFRVKGELNPLLSLNSLFNRWDPQEAIDIFSGPWNTRDEFLAYTAKKDKASKAELAKLEADTALFNAFKDVTEATTDYEKAALFKEAQSLGFKTAMEREKLAQEKLATQYGQYSIGNPRLYGPYEPSKTPIPATKHIEKQQLGVYDPGAYSYFGSAPTAPAYHQGLRENPYGSIRGTQIRSELREEKKAHMQFQTEREREEHEFKKKKRERKEKQREEEFEEIKFKKASEKKEKELRDILEIKNKKERKQKLLDISAKYFDSLDTEELKEVHKLNESKKKKYSKIAKDFDRGLIPREQAIKAKKLLEKVKRNERTARNLLTQRKYKEESSPKKGKVLPTTTTTITEAPSSQFSEAQLKRIEDLKAKAIQKKRMDEEVRRRVAEEKAAGMREMEKKGRVGQEVSKKEKEIEKERRSKSGFI